MISILAVVALPVAFLSGGVAFYSWRSGEAKIAVTATAVFALCALTFIAAPKKYPPVSECYTDWDGRANSTVCY